MSVIRLSGKDKTKIAELVEKILNSWRFYTDESAYIYAETDGEKHNTITPIAGMRDGNFELDLVLRNNITTKEYPDGKYHAHPEYHHLKKENIGLIEVMGLAVLPSRLLAEMGTLKNAILSNTDISSIPETAKHETWAICLKKNIVSRQRILTRLLKMKSVSFLLKSSKTAVFMNATKKAKTHS